MTLDRFALCLLLASSVGAQTEIRSFDAGPSAGFFDPALASAGDVNADGVDDVIIGAYNAALPFFPGTPTGAAIVYSGVDGTELYRKYGSFFEGFFGRSVGSAGDVDGDGHDDFVVGESHRVSLTGPGRAHVYSGADGSLLHTVTGANAGDFFGVSCAAAGDVNADGYDDVIVGADQIDPVHPMLGWFGPGYAVVISGRDGSTMWTFTGDSAPDGFGSYVGGIGDVTGDGYDDVLVGGPGRFGPGYVRLFSGADGSLIREHFAGSSGYLSAAIAGGDCDGDRVADYLVGDLGGALGEVRVYSGATGNVVTTIGGATSTFGLYVSGAGDVDGDGAHEVMIYDGTDVQLHRILPTPALVHTFVRQSTAGVTGRNFASAGDLNGDAFDDVLIANFDTPGRVQAFELGFTGTPPHARDRGAACVGGVGLLRVGHVGDARIQDSTTVTLRGATPGTFASMFVGRPTNVSLDAFGLVGCSLLVDPFLALPVYTGTGRAAVELKWPSSPAEVGSSIDFQWLSLEPAAPHALPLATSNALHMVVGL